MGAKSNQRPVGITVLSILYAVGAVFPLYDVVTTTKTLLFPLEESLSLGAFLLGIVTSTGLWIGWRKGWWLCALQMIGIPVGFLILALGFLLYLGIPTQKFSSAITLQWVLEMALGIIILIGISWYLLSERVLSYFDLSRNTRISLFLTVGAIGMVLICIIFGFGFWRAKMGWL